MSLILSLLSGNQSLDPTSTPSFNGLLTTKNVGTAPSGVTAVEYGDGFNHTTILTLNTTLGAIAGGAALGLGKLIYTFPAGALNMCESYMSVALTQTQGNINANTPYIGIGSVVASGVISALNGTYNFNNIMSQQLAANCTGTPTVKTIDENIDSGTIEVADAHTAYLNFAANWAAGGDAAAIITGTVVLKWQFMQ